MDKNYVYCQNCLHYMQTTHHPFYPNELVEGCRSNPVIINNYLNKKVEYKNPKDKNYENSCKEYAPKMASKITSFFKKFLPL